jgi:hypothetical protein
MLDGSGYCFLSETQPAPIQNNNTGGRHRARGEALGIMVSAAAAEAAGATGTRALGTRASESNLLLHKCVRVLLDAGERLRLPQVRAYILLSIDLAYRPA